MAIDDKDRLYVVDSIGQAVQVYRPLVSGAPSPEFVDKFGEEGTVDGAFYFPNGIAVDARGHVYVADWYERPDPGLELLSDSPGSDAGGDGGRP